MSELIDEMERVTKENMKKAVNVFQDNKDILATEFQKIQPYLYDKNMLWWLWNNNNNWEIIDEYDLINSLRKNAEQKYFQASTNKFWNETIRSMKLIGRENQPEPVPKTWIQFKDKIIDYQTKKEIKITHQHFNVNTIPWKCKTGETPTINKIFTQWVGKENVQTLKEIIAYCMIQDYPLHRIFCLTGSGLNGKGIYQALIRKIIGEKNVSSTELDLIIDNRFETTKLYKKLVCQMGETNFSEISKTSMIKKLSGQDLIGIEFKNKNPFDTVNYAKLIINTNSLPPTMDKTDGFYRRWMIVDFPNKFNEGIDVLSMISDDEIENLCGECISLLPELIIRGRFHNEGNIMERRKKYEEKSNPINSFIDENYKKNPDGKVPIFEFEDFYNSYLKDRGLRTINRKGLIRLLKNDGFEIERENVKRGEKWTKWTFIYGLDTLDTLDTYSPSPHTYRAKGDSMSNPSKLSKADLGFLWKYFENGGENLSADYLFKCAKLKIKELSIDEIDVWLSKKKEEGDIYEPRPGRFSKL